LNLNFFYKNYLIRSGLVVRDQDINNTRMNYYKQQTPMADEDTKPRFLNSRSSSSS